MSAHLDPESVEIPENCIYELKSVIIHRGGAYGGHYHAYIQDELGEGVWHLEMPAEFKKEPEVVTKKAFNPKDHMTEEQLKKLEEGATDEGKPLSLEPKLEEEVKKEVQPPKVEPEVEEEDLSKVDTSKMTKHEKKQHHQKVQQQKQKKK